MFPAKVALPGFAIIYGANDDVMKLRQCLAVKIGTPDGRRRYQCGALCTAVSLQ